MRREDGRQTAVGIRLGNRTSRGGYGASPAPGSVKQPVREEEEKEMYKFMRTYPRI